MYPLPQPISSGSVDLSSIKPVSSGSVSIADAIAKARGFAAERGVSYDSNRGIHHPFLFYCSITDQDMTSKFHQEMMILGDEADAHVHPRAALLVPSETASETTTILIVMKGEAEMIAVMSENDHSPHDLVADFPRLIVVRTAY